MYPTAELDRLCVVLVAPRNPLNIGAAARAMSNFGACELRVVNPYEVAFREARSAVGAAELLAGAQEFSNLADAVRDCALVVATTAATRRELQHPLRRLEAGGRLIRRTMQSAKVALLFGSEKVGLSTRDLTHCHWLLRIPTRAEHSSMNLAQAVAVCLYELVREVRTPPGEEKKLRPIAGDSERMTQLMLQALISSGYVKPRSTHTTEEKLRRMVHRLQLEPQDAEVWLGMLRKIVWKLDH